MSITKESLWNTCTYNTQTYHEQLIEKITISNISTVANIEYEN